MNEIVKQVVEEIKQLPNGERFTVAEFLGQHGIDVKDTKTMFEYYRLIFSQISNIVRTPEEYAGAKVGLPFNIPLKVSKK